MRHGVVAALPAPQRPLEAAEPRLEAAAPESARQVVAAQYSGRAAAARLPVKEALRCPVREAQPVEAVEHCLG